MHRIFGNKMTNEDFLKCLANKLSIGHSEFIVYVQNWRKINFLEVRGLTEMRLEIKQKIYNVWVENSINSMDCRNGRNMINITKCKYLSLYQQLENKIVKVEERKKMREYMLHGKHSVIDMHSLRH